MIVTSSGRIIAGNRIIINDMVNEFLGTVNNLWSNPANWSLGVIPAANHIAIIKANCLQQVGILVRELRIAGGITFTSNQGLQVNDIINFGTLSLGSFTTTITSGLATVLGNISISGMNILVFTGLGDLVINALNYYGLRLLGSGKRTLSANLVVISDLYVGGQGSGFGGTALFDPDGFDVTVGNFVQAGFANATTTASSKSGTINILGNLSLGAAENIAIPNYTIKVHGNLSAGSGSAGTNVINCLVLETHGNNSLMTGNRLLNANCPIKIISGKILIVQNGFVLAIYNSIYGENSVSELQVKSTLNIYTPAIVMATGIFKADYNDSLVVYNGTNQDVRATDDSRYRMLRLINSGTKKLTANTSCEHLYFSGTATLDLNGFTLTGYTRYTDARTISANLPSGNFETLAFGTTTATRTLTLTGNIVCDTFDASNASALTIVNNGFNISCPDFNMIYRGNATVYHHDYNLLNFWNGGLKTLTGNINVKTLNIQGGGTNTINFNGFTMNVENIVLISIAGTIHNLYGGNYTNIDISGNGSVQLQGNVIVTGTYSRAVGVTFNKNGFTIKNGSGVDLE
ncbi:hypothetical protein [Pedobacter sp. ASV28]|uniref:hypothetical protein n=1 Tax=Pedobacter sp. ASV28 TaxID=2795123 RepID=UPI0018ECC24A|nr:hypothetical protein [Pedobacter sp. ASV28]